LWAEYDLLIVLCYKKPKNYNK